MTWVPPKGHHCVYVTKDSESEEETHTPLNAMDTLEEVWIKPGNLPESKLGYLAGTCSIYSLHYAGWEAHLTYSVCISSPSLCEQRRFSCTVGWCLTGAGPQKYPGAGVVRLLHLAMSYG